ncbi:MAG: Rha family transcriptional regulator [Nitrospirota bacterium]|nr:Rha family transcriptional regulator [Nitrospirota bacterium]
MTIPVLSPDFTPEIQVVHDRITTTSLAIASTFGKRHDNVLRDIQSLEVPEEFNRLNFEAVEYKDAKGEMRPMVLITRDGFTILAMGFTGKRAMEFKIKYIEAFNRMEAKLRGKAQAALPPSGTLTPSHKRDLQEIIASRASEYPEGLRGGIYPQLWGKLKTHFRVGSYTELTDALFEEAKAYLERVPLDEPAPARGIGTVEKPKATPADLQSARDMLIYLERWGQDLPEPARMSFLELVTDLKRIVVHDWTAVDEALLRIGTGLAMLRRFRGFPG